MVMTMEAIKADADRITVLSLNVGGRSSMKLDVVFSFVSTGGLKRSGRFSTSFIEIDGLNFDMVSFSDAVVYFLVSASH